MATTSSIDVKSVKVPTFNGKRDAFQVWWLRFSAFAKAYKFKKAIEVTPEADLPAQEEPTSNETADQEAARERNSTAMYYLTLAFDQHESMKFLFKGMTTDYPNGLAHLVIKALMKKFRPKDATSNLEFMRALMRIKMGARESPSVLFTQICTLQNRYGVYNRDEQQIITEALPTEYKVVLASEKRINSGVLDLDDVEDLSGRLLSTSL